MGRHLPTGHARRRPRFRPTPTPLEARALMAYAGSLDPTFGGGLGYHVGPVTTGTGAAVVQLANLTSVAVEADGSVVVAYPDGTASGLTFAVTHLKADGALDTSFGVAGKADVVLPTGFKSAGGPSVLLVQPDGKIIVVGEAASISSRVDTVVARFNADGSADSTFGTAGVEVLDQGTLGVPNASLVDVALQGDGKLVLAGTSTNTTSISPITVVRLGTGGALDPTFGTNGVVTLSDTSAREETDGVAIQPNGQIVVLADIPQTLGTHTTFTAALIRLNADGSRDASLSQAGITSSGIDDPNSNGLIVEPDGQLLVLGGHTIGSLPDAVPTLARLNADGSLAKSLPLPGIDVGVTSFALQPDGDIVLTGYNIAGPAGVPAFAAFRLKPDLTPDATFGLGGLSVVTIPAPAGSSAGFVPQVVAVDPDNRVILVGSNPLSEASGEQAPPTNYVVARLTSTGSAHPGDFTGDGIADPAVYLPALGAFAIRPSQGGPDEIVPFGIPGPGQTIPAPGDYTGSGSEEIAAYLPALGIYAYRPAGGGPDVLVRFGIAGPGQTIPAPGDYFGTGQDDLAVYLPALGAFGIHNPDGGPDEIIPFGIAGAGQSIPVPGDYDGSGKTELAVYLPALGAYAYHPADGGPDKIIPFGMPGAGNTIPMPGDYDGSGKTELAVYLPSLGKFVYRPADGGADVVMAFGIAGPGQTIAAQGDYTGSGRTELGVYLPALGELAYRPAGGGADVRFSYGIAGPGRTIPVEAVVQSPFPGTSTASAASIQVPGPWSAFDPLDFLPTSKEKPKPGDAPASGPSIGPP